MRIDYTKPILYLCVWILTLALLQTPSNAAEAEQPKTRTTKSGRHLISIEDLVPEVTPVSDYAGDIWHRSTLFGDLAGKRQQLYDFGVTFDMALTQVVQSVVSGGNDAGGARYNGLLDYGLTFDTGKLGWWSGALFVFNAETSFGNPLKTEPGSLSPVNMTSILSIPFENDTVLMEYYLVQGLPKNSAFIIGRMNLANFGDKNRFASNPRNQFLNTSLNNNPLFGAFFSFSTYAATLAVPVTKNLTLAGLVYDPETKPGDYGGVWDNIGVTFAPSYKWEFAGGLGGLLTGYFLYASKDSLSLDNPRLVPGLIKGSVPKKSGNWMVNFTFEQYLWKPEKSAAAPSDDQERPFVQTRPFNYHAPGVGLFFRYAYLPENRNPWNMFISGGVSGRGLIPGRPYDRMGFGVYTMVVSNDVNNQPLIGRILETEIGLEAYYNFAITPWLQVTADFQWIDPGIAANDNTFVLGTRIFVEF